MPSVSWHRSLRKGALMRARHLLITAIVAATFGAAASSAAAWSGGGGGSPARVNIVVSPGKTPPKPSGNTYYYKTIQEAVNEATSGDWVLIEPGTYHEKPVHYENPKRLAGVEVTSAQSGIWIRGMDRNKVIVDGQKEAGNGIEIYKANNVWVENLTVKNYDQSEECGDEACGNDIWWNGGSESGKIGAEGWYGSYLTAYDTGLLGGYGIFTNNEINGSWNNIYASGFNDSGMYLGACQNCKARISNATMENNALGYSGSNAGGSLVIEKSNFINNSAGIVPNSENPGDGPPPQDGECGRENVEHPSPTPEIKSTKIPRCTIIRYNVIANNNNLSAPAVGRGPEGIWGTGLVLPGDYADLVEQNVIYGNVNNGIVGLEYPNPFPPGPETIFFQLAGNKISGNLLLHNGYNPTYKGNQFAGDVTLTGGYSQLFGSPEPSQSVNNCVSSNWLFDATFPKNIEGTWGCQNNTTPIPGYGGIGSEGLPESVEYLLQLKGESEARHSVGQPAPPPQQTMPNPCEGVPANPLCPKA